MKEITAYQGLDGNIYPTEQEARTSDIKFAMGTARSGIMSLEDVRTLQPYQDAVNQIIENRDTLGAIFDELDKVIRS